jgi:hypothetical protein
MKYERMDSGRIAIGPFLPNQPARRGSMIDESSKALSGDCVRAHQSSVSPNLARRLRAHALVKPQHDAGDAGGERHDDRKPEEYSDASDIFAKDSSHFEARKRRAKKKRCVGLSARMAYKLLSRMTLSILDAALGGGGRPGTCEETPR